MDEKSRDLLLRITRCPILVAARTDPSHPCSTIVSLQSGVERHVPEPWCGHIDTAPILFVSSNPSIFAAERFPTQSWSAADTADYFERRFDADAGYISPKTYNGVRFWSSVRARAREILGRDATPGIDFALTEVVHCKSRQEKGVAAAVDTCAGMWLGLILAQSEARVVVLLGKRAQMTFSKIWGLGLLQSAHFGIDLGGRDRAVVLLPHPNAFARKTVAARVGEDNLRQLRGFIKDDVAVTKFSVSAEEDRFDVHEVVPGHRGLTEVDP